jgi:glycosyltransferase involved in cell wall biosynthesis
MLSKKAVAVIVADGIYGKGGIARATLYSTRQVAADAPDIPLLIQHSRWALPGPLKHASALYALAQFASRLARGRIGAAHINVAPRGSTFRKMLFAKAAALAGVPVILHLHGGGYEAFYTRLPAFLRPSVGRFFRAANRIIVLGNDYVNLLTAELGVDPGRLTTVENGVAAASRRADPTHARPTIAFLGHLVPSKGLDDLMVALALLAQRDVDFRAVLAGIGEIDRYRAEAEATGIADRIAFPGWLDEGAVGRLLADSDIFVLPSLVENQPVSILEAMAHALPVVATPVGGIPEQVVDGETGMLVPPADAGALAGALERLCADPERRRAMGERGLERWRRDYSLEATAAKLIGLYRRYLN